MNIKITNKGHRRGFVQGHVLNPGDSVELNDVNKDLCSLLIAISSGKPFFSVLT